MVIKAYGKKCRAKQLRGENNSDKVEGGKTHMLIITTKANLELFLVLLFKMLSDYILALCSSFVAVIVADNRFQQAKW